jgi:hypothetical protein
VWKLQAISFFNVQLPKRNGLIAQCFGATNVPSNLEQYWQWCERWFPFGKQFHPWGECFGATNVPSNLEQYWQWCERWFPFSKQFHPWGVVAICWAIWKSRNKACFEQKLINNPLEIICHACALMIYWSGLFAEFDHEQLVEGANTMLRVAKEILAAQTARHVNRLLLQDGESLEHEQEDPAQA